MTLTWILLSHCTLVLISEQKFILLYQPGLFPSLGLSLSSILALTNPPTWSLFVSQSLRLVEHWARPWASWNPALWRASRRPCRKQSKAASKPRCPSIARGLTWSEGGDATRASASPSTSPTKDLPRTVRPVLKTEVVKKARKEMPELQEPRCQIETTQTSLF